MPYVINRPPAKRARALAVRGALLGVIAAAATFASAAPALADTSSCTAPVLTQPFLSWGDSNYYALAPGESVDSFAGTGWTLNGGANIMQTQLADGTTGYVLDLPHGSSAVSPPMCVTSDYPAARTMVQDPGGWAVLGFSVSYQNADGSWTIPQLTGLLHGQGGSWTLSNPLSLNPGGSAGWQLVQFTFTSTGTSDYQLYNFYVDPYAKG